MDEDVVKAHLHQKLRAARGALVWKLDGLSEYDTRRPMTPIGTNVMAARLVDAVRHAGHADILRESLDGAVGLDAGGLPLHGRDTAYWKARHSAGG